MATRTATPSAGIAELKVAGRYYGGWKTLRASRSIEQMAGTFELGVTERRSGQTEQLALRPGLPGQLLLDSDPVITGYLDDVQPSYDAKSHGVTLPGRDKTGDLVDCSAIHKSGQWHNATIAQIAADLIKPFGLDGYRIKLVMEADAGKPFSSFNINQGETVFECLDRAARMKALLLTSNADGDLVITRASSTVIPVRLEEGKNIKSANGTFSWRERFSTYKVIGQETGDDDFFGENAAHPSASVSDEAITRYRPLIVHAEEHSAGTTLAQRAEWERNVRMGRGNRATITVQGWRRPDGVLWQPNTLVRVVSPKLWLDADMLIVGCTWTLDERGTLTELSIARREAFDLVTGIGKSRLDRKLNDKEQREKKKKGDDWSNL